MMIFLELTRCFNFHLHANRIDTRIKRNQRRKCGDVRYSTVDGWYMRQIRPTRQPDTVELTLLSVVLTAFLFHRHQSEEILSGLLADNYGVAEISTVMRVVAEIVIRNGSRRSAHHIVRPANAALTGGTTLGQCFFATAKSCSPCSLLQ